MNKKGDGICENQRDVMQAREDPKAFVPDRGGGGDHLEKQFVYLYSFGRWWASLERKLVSCAPEISDFCGTLKTGDLIFLQDT